MTKVEKAKVAAIKVLAAPILNRNVKQPRRLAKTSEFNFESSEEEMSMYSSSEKLSEVPIVMSVKRFSEEKRRNEQWGVAPHCRQWLHPECMDVDFLGKNPRRLQLQSLFANIAE